MALRWFRSEGPSERFAADLRARDPSAWEVLVEDEYARVYHLQLRLTSDPDVAADLTQETFAAAYEAIDTFRGRCRPSTWLYGVALNYHRGWRRAQGRREPPETLDEDLPDAQPTAEELAVLRERRELLYDAVQRLPEVYRRTVALRCFAGLSTAEVAAGEGVEEGTVRWRVHRAVQRLWQMLQPTMGEEAGDGRGPDRELRVAP
jgi:RNA polymerase sigma-70 factor (ECF subfamily)